MCDEGTLYVCWRVIARELNETEQDLESIDRGSETSVIVVYSENLDLLTDKGTTVF